jgi:hypothetical protein
MRYPACEKLESIQMSADTGMSYQSCSTRQNDGSVRILHLNAGISPRQPKMALQVSRSMPTESKARAIDRTGAIQHGQDALIRLGRVFRFRSAIAGLIKASPSIGGVAHAPFRRRAGRAANRSANRTAGHALGRHQHNPRPLAQPEFGLGGTRQRFQLGSFRFRQYDRGRFRNAMHASLNHDSTPSCEDVIMREMGAKRGEGVTGWKAFMGVSW